MKQKSSSIAVSVAVGLTAAGCSMAAPETDETTDSFSMDLLGDVTTPAAGASGACTAAQKTLIQDGMKFGRTAARSSAFRECLDVTMRSGRTFTHRVDFDKEDGATFTKGPYGTCAADPIGTASLQRRIARAQSAAVSRLDVAETCPSSDEGRSVGGEAPFTHSADSQSFRWTSLGRGADEFKVADIAWHEAMHTEGYEHECQAIYMIEYCLREVLEYSANRCGGVTNIYDQTLPACADGHNGGYSMIKYMSYATKVANPTPTNCTCVADVLDDNESGDEFGNATAAGDFDNDGIQDLVIGAPGENDDGGAVYLLRGGAFGLTFWRVIRQSGLYVRDYERDKSSYMGDGDDHFGHALASADFNNDGYDDLVVSLLMEGVTQSDAGYVVIIPGGSSGLNPLAAQGISQTGATVDGLNETGDRFGYALAAGDIDQDGFADLAVGTPGEVLGSVKSGIVYTFKGRADGSTSQYLTPWQSIDQALGGRSNDANDAFGTALALANGDNDSYLELAIGAPGENSSAGYVYVYGWNGSGFRLEQNVTNGESGAGAKFGTAVAWGNFIGSSPLDLAVGAPGQDSGSGRIHVLEGPGLNSRTLLSQSPGGANQSEDGLGSSLAAGRLDGDAYDDIAAGAPNEDAGGSADAGIVFVYRGSASGPVYSKYIRQTDLWDALGDEPEQELASERFGNSVLIANIDGAAGSELIVGARANSINVSGGTVTSGSVFQFDYSTQKAAARIDQFTAVYGDTAL